jgi:hypothetical protein
MCFAFLLRVLRTNKRYPLEKYIHLIIACANVELKLSFKHIMFGNKCERQQYYYNNINLESVQTLKMIHKYKNTVKIPVIDFFRPKNHFEPITIERM